MPSQGVWPAPTASIPFPLPSRFDLDSCCSCTSDAGFCKHVIALGLTYIEEPQSFYDLRTLTAQLEQYSHGELVELILQIGTRYPQTLGMLGVEGFDDEEDEDVIDDDELDDDEEDEFEDEDEDLDDEDDEDLEMTKMRRRGTVWRSGRRGDLRTGRPLVG